MNISAFSMKMYSTIIQHYYNFFERNIFIGKNVGIRKGFYLRAGEDATIHIGEGCFFNRCFSGVAYSRIKIGDNCIFGENVKIYDHNHIFNRKDVLIKKQGFNIKDVVIGNNVWIGSNVTILKGVTIGNNCVIAAGCVIKEDVPSDAVVSMDIRMRTTPIEYINI